MDHGGNHSNDVSLDVAAEATELERRSLWIILSKRENLIEKIIVANSKIICIVHNYQKHAKVDGMQALLLL